MSLTLRNDSSHPGGGFARLDGPDLVGVTSIAVKNDFSGLFLGDDGKWGRHPFAFPIEEHAPGTLLLGPHIVDHIPTELRVELLSGDGRLLGKLFWVDVMPSRNTGSVTSAQVLEDRRRRAARVAEEQAAIVALAAQKAAEDRAAHERAAQEQAAQDQAAALAAAEAEQRREADRERAQSAALDASTVGVETEPTLMPSARRRWPLVLALVLLPLAAVAAILAAKPGLLGTPSIAVKPPSPVTPSFPFDPSPSVDPSPRPDSVDRVIPPRAPEPPTPSPRQFTRPNGLVARGDIQPSFACAPNLREPVARLICADADLAEADAQLGAVYRRALANTPPAFRRALVLAQIAWVRERVAACGIPTVGAWDIDTLAPMKGCLLEQTEQRTAALGRE